MLNNKIIKKISIYNNDYRFLQKDGENFFQKRKTKIKEKTK